MVLFLNIQSCINFNFTPYNTYTCLHIDVNLVNTNDQTTMRNTYCKISRNMYWNQEMFIIYIYCFLEYLMEAILFLNSG